MSPVRGLLMPSRVGIVDPMAETETPTLTSTVTITRSSHPEFTYFTVTEAFLDGRPTGRRARHDHTDAEVDAHLAQVRASAARLGVTLTIDDARHTFR
jgi:hypothetical protein